MEGRLQKNVSIDVFRAIEKLKSARRPQQCCVQTAATTLKGTGYSKHVFSKSFHFLMKCHHQRLGPAFRESKIRFRGKNAGSNRGRVIIVPLRVYKGSVCVSDERGPFW